MKRPSTRGAARVVLLAGALVAAVLIAELLLQAGALVLRASGRGTATSFRAERGRVLAFGDSHTYGLYLKPDESYPSQLEALWNSDPDALPIEVVNLGYPGTNSSVVAREFGKALRALSPDVAIVLIGVNDTWTEPVEPVAEPGAWDHLVALLRTHSRVLRFVSILVPGSEPDDPGSLARRDEEIPSDWTGKVAAGGAEMSLGFEGIRPERRGIVGPRLAANLKRLVDEANRQGVEPVLMTYPVDAFLYNFVNAVIRQTAKSSGARLVDVAQLFRQRCSDPECAELLFPDRHPNPAGYALIAETLSEQIGDLLDR